MVSEGQFRQDLYYRLQVFPLRLPPLRERQEDIPLLAEYFTRRYAQHLSRPVPQITPAALVQLQSYPWPGNVRELEHLMQRAVLLCQNNRIEAGDVALQVGAEGRSEEGLLTLAEQEKRLIERALEATGGVIFGEQGAARLLGINPQTLRYRLKKHGIRKPQS
ncbi:MAG: sigma-54-dependent Fis family transcriptional regulator [Candidatus Latescibacteria bacterium]|nr:sigma-54-dependent Fis family transcriptional regulator [Candidatus Latescibacterota bacterium]